MPCCGHHLARFEGLYGEDHMARSKRSSAIVAWIRYPSLKTAARFTQATQKWRSRRNSRVCILAGGPGWLARARERSTHTVKFREYCTASLQSSGESAIRVGAGLCGGGQLCSTGEVHQWASFFWAKFWLIPMTFQLQAWRRGNGGRSERNARTVRTSIRVTAQMSLVAVA